MVTVFQIKRWHIKNDAWEYFPGKYTAERFAQLVALSHDVKPVKVDGSEEKVDQFEIDANGWYDPSKSGQG